MTEYLVPARAASAEFTEKRSVFLGQVWPVDSEEQARACVEGARKRHHDARHNCWCYLIQDGPARCSDDGEPQGTAGRPMLAVFQREGVTGVCCVVTRYFGGVLLGTGGLIRAYTRAARDALAAAGISAVRRWAELAVRCPYRFLERVKSECAALGGVVGEIEYAAAVTVRALLPEERAEAFSGRMTELSAGGIEAVKLGETLRAVPISG